jgi:hypothetical protein
MSYMTFSVSFYFAQLLTQCVWSVKSFLFRESKLIWAGGAGGCSRLADQALSSYYMGICAPVTSVQGVNVTCNYNDGVAFIFLLKFFFFR